MPYFTKTGVPPLLIIANIVCFAFTASAQYHSADTTQDNRIDMSELLRVIQFYNSDGLHCATGTEDGYDPGPGDQTCPPHDSDYNPQDWFVDLSELLRLVQFYNSGEYHVAPGTEDGFAPRPDPGETKIILLPGDVPLEMVWIPGGTFMMGRYPGEDYSFPAEDPQHEVTVPDFWMGKYEVTQAQWQAIMGSNPSRFSGANRPVEQISWSNAKSFVSALSIYTNLTFRLPSEAEWEYAARAGTTTRFYWGDDPSYTEIGNYAWYWNNSGSQTHVVGQKLPNAFGLYDMSGNVWEWCEDDYYSSYTGAPTNGSAWVDSPRRSSRVSRGGCYYDHGGNCRSAQRSNALNGARGFRLSKQSPFSGLTVLPSQQNVSASSGTTSFSVSNTGTGTMNWTASVTSGGSWLRITSGSSGSNLGTINLAYDANPNTSLRTGTIQVTASGATGSPTTVSVVQEGIDDGAEETILLPGDVPLEMVWIPGGTFMRGRYPGEQDSHYSEDPQHEVTVPGFWMGKYELTKRQWSAVMGTTPWSGLSYVLNDPDSPAVWVSWNDAKEFISALNIHTGLTFRLPSEAEWEYAARAGTTTRFYWGDDPGYTVGNAYCWWTYNAWDVGNLYAHVVGQKIPNAFGLYDMSGNVWEWCEDDWHSNYNGAPTNGSAWVNSPRGSLRVGRGGGWGDYGYYCRSAYRGSYGPSDTPYHYGFRLSR